MEFLLDTHVLLWSLYDDEKISSRVKELLQDSANTFYVSTVTEYEVVIKQSVGKLNLKFGFRKFLERVDEMNFSSLEIKREHLLEYENLPLHHRDPFDRLLIAQAKSEKLKVITKDENFKHYDVEIVW